MKGTLPQSPVLPPKLLSKRLCCASWLATLRWPQGCAECRMKGAHHHPSRGNSNFSGPSWCQPPRRLQWQWWDLRPGRTANSEREVAGSKMAVFCSSCFSNILIAWIRFFDCTTRFSQRHLLCPLGAASHWVRGPHQRPTWLCSFHPQKDPHHLPAPPAFAS